MKFNKYFLYRQYNTKIYLYYIQKKSYSCCIISFSCWSFVFFVLFPENVNCTFLSSVFSTLSRSVLVTLSTCNTWGWSLSLVLVILHVSNTPCTCTTSEHRALKSKSYILYDSYLPLLAFC